MGIKYLLLPFFVCASQLTVKAQISHPSFVQKGVDSVVTYASDRYKVHSFLRRILMGRNYRREWEQPVTLPVFRLSGSGFKVIELGGGMQTKSLKLEGKDGKSWALRTVDKDVAGAMPPLLKNSFVQKLVQDQISAAMPYGVPVVGALAKSAGVRAAQPVIYFVADDPAFGPYRSIFANTVCMLEERDPGFESTLETEEFLHQLQKKNSILVDQKSLLKARLLDMLISDWDRHYDNWRWGSRDSAGLHIFQAIPRDRDWAFYYCNGFVPRLMRLVALRFLINFKENPRYIKSLSAKAHIFDGIFLNGLTADDWRAGVRELQQSLTDEALANAIQQLPADIYALNRHSFFKKLKGRRDNLEGPVLKYYRYLAQNVQIDGTADGETFSFLPAEGGFLLQIFRNNNGAPQKIYERRFLRSETYRVIINGLGGDDQFRISEQVATTIRLKLNGGSGRDSYELNGRVSAEVHDDKESNDIVANKTRARIYFH